MKLKRETLQHFESVLGRRENLNNLPSSCTAAKVPPVLEAEVELNTNRARVKHSPAEHGHGLEGSAGVEVFNKTKPAWGLCFGVEPHDDTVHRAHARKECLHLSFGSLEAQVPNVDPLASTKRCDLSTP